MSSLRTINEGDRDSRLLPQNMIIETEIEENGRWIADIPDLPGVLVYGETREEAISKVKALALRILAERLEHGEKIPDLEELFKVAA